MEVQAILDQKETETKRLKADSSEEELPKMAEEVADWEDEERESEDAVRRWQAEIDPEQERRRRWKLQDQVSP